MPVIAIIGAGKGMGLAIAKLFGSKGFKVALLARNPGKLEPVIAELSSAGIEAASFQADVTVPGSLAAALAAAKERFGSIDVLEYSPATPDLPMVASSQLDRDTLEPWLDFQLYGAIAAVHEVLPDMLARGSGTIIVTTGASSVRPEAGYPLFGAIGVAMGALRNWARALHTEVADKGIQVAHVAIGVYIGQTPETSADAIAPLYWDLHTNRAEIERVFG